jgi:hypothetical protein
MIQGSAGRPSPRQASTAASAMRGIDPTNGSRNHGLRIARLMFCILSTSVRSDERARPGITEQA